MNLDDIFDEALALGGGKPAVSAPVPQGDALSSELPDSLSAHNSNLETQNSNGGNPAVSAPDPQGDALSSELPDSLSAHNSNLETQNSKGNGPVEPGNRYAGKFKSPEELERAYLEIEKLSGRQANELGELRGKVNGGLPPAQNPAASFSAAAGQNNGSVVDTLFGDYDNEKLSAALLAKPIEVLRAIEQGLLERTSQSFDYKNEVDRAARQFFGDNPDLVYMIDDFKDYANRYGNVEDALAMVRGKKAGNLDSLLDDDVFVKNNLNRGGLKRLFESDEVIGFLPDSVKAKIIEGHVGKLAESAPGVPPLAAGSGAAPARPARDYDSVDDILEETVRQLTINNYVNLLINNWLKVARFTRVVNHPVLGVVSF
jgi:hypothetical protein